MPTTTTQVSILPEVMADLVETKLGARASLLPLAARDNTLKGQPGDTLRFPAFRYIGKADEIAENGQITPNLLTSYAVPATVKKYAKAVQITDEVRLSGFGDPVGEAAGQLAKAIDHAVDDALYEQLHTLPLSRIYPVAGLSTDAVADGLTLFGEDLDGEKVILVDPAGYAALRKDPDYIRASDLGQKAIFSGVVGEIWGCQVVVTAKIGQNTTLNEHRYYILKPGALRLINKTGTFIEVQLEPYDMRDTVYASKHCAAYLYDDTKVVALSVFTGVQTLPNAAEKDIYTRAKGSGNTSIVITDYLKNPPATCKWAYVLNTSPTFAATFGAAVTGATPWVNEDTAIPAGANTYAHVLLLDRDNKPLKKASVALIKG